MGEGWLLGDVSGSEPAVDGAQHPHSSPPRGPDCSQAEHSGHTNEASETAAEVSTGAGKSWGGFSGCLQGQEGPRLEGEQLTCSCRTRVYAHASHERLLPAPLPGLLVTPTHPPLASSREI